MEFSDIPTHPQGRHSRHQSRHRKNRVAHSPRALGSEHRGSLPLWSTREEHAQDGNKQRLVDTWLQDIETPRLQQARNNESRSREPGSRAHAQPGSSYRLRGPSPSTVVPQNSRRKHQHLRDPAKDNSVLGLCDKQDLAQVQSRISKTARPVSVATDSDYESGKKRPHSGSRMGSQDSVVSVISRGQYHFSKKVRRKTRSDRYDTMRVHEPRQAGKKKGKKPKDQKGTRGTKRAGDFSSAREVMGNFNSESILSDRITVRTPLPDQ